MDLIIKTNDVSGDSSYKDGDIVQAFSNDRIYMCHAEMICKVENFPLDTVTGLRPNDGLLMKFMENTHQFKFVRINESEVKRINLDTDEETIIGKTPNGDGEYIYVHELLVRFFKDANHKIFGSSDAEIWYGGSRAPNIDSVWSDIETHTSNIKSDHASWPLTDIEKRHFLPLNASGFKNDVAVELSSGTVSERNKAVYKEEVIDGEEESVLFAKRQWRVPYWDLSATLDINVDDVRNKDVALDARKLDSEKPHIDDVNIDKIAAGIIVI